MNWVIVTAGGRGQRLGLGFNKIFAKIGRLPVIYWTLLTLEKSRVVDRIVISASKSDIGSIKKLVSKYKFKKVFAIIAASVTRQLSTQIALAQISARDNDLVGVHNGANPFVSDTEIGEVFKSARRYGAAILAQPARDTVKITNGEMKVFKTPVRENVWLAQTPQVSTFKNLYNAHLKAKKDGFVGTDDAQLLERAGVSVKVVACSNKNFKITFPEDLVIANYIVKRHV